MHNNQRIMEQQNDNQVNSISNQRLEYADDDEIKLSSTKYIKQRIIQSIIDFICIIIAFIAFILVYLFVEPRIRGLHCNDTDLFNPYKDDTVEFWVVGLYATLGPVVFIVFIELINSKIIFCKCQKSRSKPAVSKKKLFFIATLHGLMLFLLGIAITLLLTEIGKRWVGRLRPHFMSVCKPNLSTMNCTTTYGVNTLYNYVYTDGTFCTNTEKLVREARLSFPSGHSSYSCYSMLFLIIYLEVRLRLLAFRFVKPLIQMTAFIAAYVTCLSRIGDYHHRGSDVIGGAVLGCLVAIFVTFFTGQVIWKFNYKKPYYDYSLKESNISKTKL
jgi:phosphatidate phosphatase